MRGTSGYASFVLFLVIALFAFLDKSDAFVYKRVDLVQIDTGNTVAHTGVLNMMPNCVACWSDHGTYMANSLEDQLRRLDASPINGEQIVWKSQSGIIRAIRQAISMNPRVIAMSLSGGDFVPEEYKAISDASARGILVVVASGNEGKDHPGYPGAYRIPCMVSVSTFQRTAYGDIEKVPTANAGDVYLPRASLFEHGTSFSTARMGGVAIKYFQENPEATCLEAKNWIKAKYSPARLGLKL